MNKWIVVVVQVRCDANCIRNCDKRNALCKVFVFVPACTGDRISVVPTTWTACSENNTHLASVPSGSGYNASVSTDVITIAT